MNRFFFSAVGLALLALCVETPLKADRYRHHDGYGYYYGRPRAEVDVYVGPRVGRGNYYNRAPRANYYYTPPRSNYYYTPSPWDNNCYYCPQ